METTKSSHMASFLTCPALMVLGPEKNVKIRLNYFSTLLTGNDRDCTTNCVGMFRVPNVVIWT